MPSAERVLSGSFSDFYERRAGTFPCVGKEAAYEGQTRATRGGERLLP